MNFSSVLIPSMRSKWHLSFFPANFFLIIAYVIIKLVYFSSALADIESSHFTYWFKIKYLSENSSLLLNHFNIGIKSAHLFASTSPGKRFGFGFFFLQLTSLLNDKAQSELLWAICQFPSFNRKLVFTENFGLLPFPNLLYCQR